MATIHDLPAEIIRLLLELLIKSGYATKDSAALLSVSRQWREIVVPIVYSCAHIQNIASVAFVVVMRENGYNVCDAQYAQAAAHCKLIKDNGHFGTVKHLLFEDSAESPRFVQNIVEALALAEYNSEGFSILKRRCDIYDNDEEEFTAEIDGSCRQVIKEFARRTAVVLPNVTTLVVNAEKCHMYVSLYAAELVGYYGKQLRSLRIYCPERIPGPIVAPRLELLGIKMNPAFQPLSFTVEPHSLKSIHLVASNLNLFWNAFTCDQDGALHFPNLETLCFDYPEQDGWAYAEHGQDTPPRMTFPKLKHLIINGYDTDIKDFGYFMSPSLTSVQIYGHWVTALKLCKQLTVPLDVLQLTVDSLDDSSSIGYIEDMSMLFQSIRNIKAVQCRIEVDGGFDISNLYWPNLTHLELSFIGSMAQIIEILPKMPDLVYLELDYCPIYDDDLTRGIYMLNHLKSNRPEPLKSNIKVFHMFYLRMDYVQELEHAVQNFRWLLPKLEFFNTFFDY